MSENTTSWVTAILFALGVVFPGLIVSGFMPRLDVLPLGAWVVIAGISASAASALASGHHRLVAALLGLIGGVGSMASIPLYVWLRSGLSDTYWSLEFILPIGLVAAPLLAIWSRFPEPPPVESAPGVPPMGVFDPPGDEPG